MKKMKIVGWGVFTNLASILWLNVVFHTVYDFSCVSEVDFVLSPVGVLLCGSLLQCHHQLESLLLLPVLPATSAMARVPPREEQDQYM